MDLLRTEEIYEVRQQSEQELRKRAKVILTYFFTYSEYKEPEEDNVLIALYAQKAIKRLHHIDLGVPEDAQPYDAENEFNFDCEE